MIFFKKFLAKKKAIKLKRQLDNIKINPEILFQIDIGRGNSIELQVFRQNSVDQFGLIPENKEGYIIIFVFNPKDPKYNLYVSNFKKSKYFDRYSNYTKILLFSYRLYSFKRFLALKYLFFLLKKISL